MQGVPSDGRWPSDSADYYALLAYFTLPHSSPTVDHNEKQQQHIAQRSVQETTNHLHLGHPLPACRQHALRCLGRQQRLHMSHQLQSNPVGFGRFSGSMQFPVDNAPVPARTALPQVPPGMAEGAEEAQVLLGSTHSSVWSSKLMGAALAADQVCRGPPLTRPRPFRRR